MNNDQDGEETSSHDHLGGIEFRSGKHHPAVVGKRTLRNTEENGLRTERYTNTGANEAGDYDMDF